MSQPPRTAPPRLPAFAPVPVKRRADGWTPLRQAEFIGRLAETGSVSAAAERVGMARETAYRLRRKAGAEEFARAWGVALAIAGRPSAGSGRAELGSGRATVSSAKVTDRELVRRLLAGRWRPVLRRGKFAGCVHEPRNSALLRHLAQGRRAVLNWRKALRVQGLLARRNSPLCRPGERGHSDPSASRQGVK